MGIVLSNAILLDIDPIHVEPSSLRIDAGTIVARGDVRPGPGDEVIDCGGAVVLPGMVNGHTHLYSALAVGMPLPSNAPTNFLEILQRVWWRLDQALDAESIEMSARIGAMDALHCGTTTLIDHHASPNCITGSLDFIERAVSSVGMRGVLCYETTDRHGHAGAQAGLDENRRYLTKCAARRDGRFAGLVGAHAAFTLNDDTLDELAGLATELGAGVHIHVAEDPCDEQACLRDHGMALIDRLERHGLLGPKSVMAHGTHLNRQAIAKVNAAGLTLAHNPRSNMNNVVGYAPLADLTCPVMLGTDGIGGDIFAEAQAAWMKSRDAGTGFAPHHIVAMLATSARRVSQSLGIDLGKLTVGAAADVVITNYVPFTPLTTANAAGHLLFALSSRHVRHVLVAGAMVLRDGQVLGCDEPELRHRGTVVTVDLWRRMESIQA